MPLRHIKEIGIWSFKPRVRNTSLKNVSSERLIELDSKITIDGNQYVGKEVFDIDSMYSAFTKSL